MSQHYSDPNRADDPHALPNIEIWHDVTENGSGWFYCFCFPGCLPDSEPCGPFKTEKAALKDARS
jgi:hypothetical protein